MRHEKRLLVSSSSKHFVKVLACELFSYENRDNTTYLSGSSRLNEIIHMTGLGEPGT
jgi:hypothetical protein